jgi:hypothetical protein
MTSANQDRMASPAKNLRDHLWNAMYLGLGLPFTNPSRKRTSIKIETPSTLR